MYYLLGMKQSGWVTRTGQYSTDIADAKTFTRDEALAQAARHKTSSNILIPVCKEDLV